MITFLLILIVIIIIVILFIIYYYNIQIEKFSNNIKIENEINKNKLEEEENKLNNNIKNSINEIENFEKINNNINNLIKNSNFENGQNLSNHLNQSGYNKIITIKNPGSSSYVLEQKKSDNLTYYEFQAISDKNSKYNLYFWLSINKPLIDELDFNKLINVKFQNEDFSNYIPKLNYNIVQKIVLSNDDNNTWFLIKYDFISGPNTKDKMNIYLNYSTELQYEQYYFTDISLYKVLIDAENFIYNNKLISFVDGYNYQSNIPTWHDLSGNGNDMFWSNIPSSDYNIGSLSTLNQKIVGFKSNLISNDNFTILFCLNKNIENRASDVSFNEKNSINDFYLISVPGNDRYAFEIKMKNNYLYLLNGKNEFKTKNELILYNKSLLSIIYNNGIMHIYLDGINVMSHQINKLYFANDSFIINKNKNLNYNFYSILFYNRVVNKNELDNIRTYFIMNKDKSFNTPDINVHHMYNSAQYTINNSDYNDSNIMFKSNNTKLVKNENVNNNFIDNFDNANYKDLCIKDCVNFCNLFPDNTQCISTCKNLLSSCNKLCDDPINSTNIICNTNNNDKCINTNCPSVYKKDGNYIVYINPNSDYAKKYNYSGTRSYGNNLEKARYTYNVNFPQCPTPKELLPGTDTNYLDTCPFIINELNPCYTSQCAGVNWNIKTYKDLKLSSNCKKSVSNYCQIYNNIDDNCKYWRPEYKNDPIAIEFRRFFEDPNDYCIPSQFKIEEHPDFDKYIKKDNIPCWGCKI